jgi:hypothetical protein
MPEPCSPRRPVDLIFRIVRSRISSGIVMRLRQTLTVGVCLLMLCASSLASSCELSCSLPASHQHFSNSESPQQSVAMSASHCDHMRMRGAHDRWPNSITQTPGCVRSRCWRSDVSSLAMRASAKNPQATDQWALAALDGESEPVHLQSTFSPVQPDRQAALSPPISTVLRI